MWRQLFWWVQSPEERVWKEVTYFRKTLKSSSRKARHWTNMLIEMSEFWLWEILQTLTAWSLLPMLRTCPRRISVPWPDWTTTVPCGRSVRKLGQPFRMWIKWCSGEITHQLCSPIWLGQPSREPQLLILLAMNGTPTSSFLESKREEQKSLKLEDYQVLPVLGMQLWLIWEAGSWVTITIGFPLELGLLETNTVSLMESITVSQLQ